MITYLTGLTLADSPSAQRFVTFWVNERCYAFRADDVAEIMHVPTITPVPQGPEALLGIANLRGSVLPVASLRRLLKIPDPTSTPALTRAIVLDHGKPVAVVVDAVDSLVTVAADRIQTKQIELGAEASERSLGSFETGIDNHAAKVLDIQALLDTAFTKRARREHRLRNLQDSLDIKQIAQPATKAEMLVTFEVGGQEFALGLESVQEILPAPSIRTGVPRAEAVVLGMTSLRGSLLPLLSLRNLLGFPATADAFREKVVVTDVAGARIGLVADQARAIVAADPALIDPVPPVLAARAGGESRIKAVYRGDSGRRLVAILAVEQLFREDVMRRLSEQGAEPQVLSGQAGQIRGSELGFVVFRLGDSEFAFPIDAVHEIALVPAQITRIPKTPKFLEGVVNLRGTVLPVIDQRRRFDMPKSDQIKGRRLVVVRTEQHHAGIIVDSVSDVLRMPEGEIQAAPELTDDIARLVRGVINLAHAGRIILVLDPSDLLTRAERGLLDKFQAGAARATA